MEEGLLFLLFIAVMVLLVRLSNFSTRLARLETQMLDQAQKMRDLARRISDLPTPSESTQQEIKREASPTNLAQKTRADEAVKESPLEMKSEQSADVYMSVDVPKNELLKSDAPQTVETQGRKSASSPIFEKFKSTAEFETLVGGNILNRIGALALIFGIGFFLKYAFDNDLISPVVRVLIGVMIGVSLIVGGMRANAKKFEVFSQGLFGAGISTLYLAIYAALNFYQLVPQAIAFVLMSAVTAVALLVALRYESRAISLLGWAGGFLTPFLLASAEPNAVGLFVYLVLLNLGMIAIVFLKAEWVVVELLSMGATFLVYALWFSEHGEKTGTLTKAFFLTLFWLMFLLSEAYRALNDERGRLRVRAVLSIFNGLFYFGCLYASVMPVWWLGIATMLIAGVYLALFWTIQKRNPVATIELTLIYSIGAIVFTAVAIEVQFADFLTVSLWSAEAAGVLWIARRTSQKHLERASLILFAVTVFRLFISPDALSYQAISDFTPILNLRTVGFLSLAVSLFISALWIEGSSTTISTLLSYAWTFIIFTLLTVEVNDYFLKREALLNETLDFSRSTRGMSFTIIWLFYAVALLWFGVKKSAKSLVNTGLFVLALGVIWNLALGFRFEPIEMFFPILNLRALAFLLVIGGLLATVSLLEQTNEGKSRTAELLRYAFTALLFILLTVEAIDYFRWSGLKSNTDDDFYRSITLVFLWTLYATPMLYFGIEKSVKPLFYAGMLAFALAVMMAVFGGFLFEPIENFVLILNFRVAAYLVLILGSAFIAITLAERKEFARLSAGFGVTAALLGVVLLVAESNDFFEQKIDVLSFGEHADATTSDLVTQYENEKQLSISASLMLYSIALMLYGIWRSRQPIRLTAMALFGLATLKIFIYDLSFLATLYRIFSFIGLGVLLLLASYLYQRFKHLILPDNPVSDNARFDKP
ncbi:MAG: DUF2339 domain-containing protein [Chloroherpetonaceae bacterium]